MTLTYEPGRTTYPCVAKYSGAKCAGHTHWDGHRFVCDTCAYSWDDHGYPRGRAVRQT